MSDEQLEKLGRLVDKCDNYAHAARIPMPDDVHRTALTLGMEELREALRELFFECGGDKETWV